MTANNIDNETLAFHLATFEFIDVRTILLKMSTEWKIIFWLAITLSLMIGWLTKSIIYSHILRTQIKEQPINILIFIEQFIHHFCGNFVLINFSVSLWIGVSIKELVVTVSGNIIDGNVYCSVMAYIHVFGAIYAEGNGLSTAIVRFLYMKKGTWLKCKYGEFRLIKRVAVANILIGIFFTVLYELENISNRSVNNICKGHSQGFEVRSFLSLL